MATALYVAYFSGLAGNSLGLFYIGNGVIAGADVGGMKYDGAYSVAENGDLDGVVEFVIPTGQQVITGVASGLEPASFKTQVKLPAGFEDGRLIRIETPVGPVNAKFEKVRDLPT